MNILPKSTATVLATSRRRSCSSLGPLVLSNHDHRRPEPETAVFATAASSSWTSSSSSSSAMGDHVSGSKRCFSLSSAVDDRNNETGHGCASHDPLRWDANRSQQLRRIVFLNGKYQRRLQKMFHSSMPAAESSVEDDYDNHAVEADGADDSSRSNNSTNNNNRSENLDYFSMFDMPHRYDIDLQALKDKYLLLMRLFHPDKQHSLSEVQELQKQKLNLDLTPNDITNAYRVLIDGHTRASHLLEIYGHPILEWSSSNKAAAAAAAGGGGGESSSELVGMDFLMDIMEFRERIETLALCSKEGPSLDVGGGPCSCGSDDKQKELQHMWKETQQYQQECEDQLKLLWKDGWNDHDDGTIKQIRKLTAQLQYWHRLETALREEMDVM